MFNVDVDNDNDNNNNNTKRYKLMQLPMGRDPDGLSHKRFEWRN